MITITAHALAEFAVADDAHRRKILQNFKYGSVPRVRYYSTAVAAARRLHSGVSNAGEVMAEAHTLNNKAILASNEYVRQRARNNARAICEYMRLAGGAAYPALPLPKGLYVAEGSVRATVSFDLHLRLPVRPGMVRLHFALRELKPAEIEIVKNCMALAAEAANLLEDAREVHVYDVHRGQIHTGRPVSARDRKVLEAALRNVEAIWSTIEPPIQRAA